ncbi:MAG: inner membrane CreD family protein [Acidobacteriota bacterium]|nr:inner membrane CreD family protein [Acidobacteriota bacterium]
MFKRIAAIIGIFACACVAWLVLGSTIFYRTENSGSALSGRVTSTWGAPQGQKPPAIAYHWQEDKTVTAEENGKIVKRVDKVAMSAPAAIEASRIVADLHLDYRQKGLLWFSTYGVKFDGSYTFHNPSVREENFIFTLPFPAQQALYDNVEILLDGQPLPLTFSGNTATAQSTIATGSTHVLRATYRSQGLESWRYNISSKTAEGISAVSQARDFDLMVRTDFSGFDFPENAMSPTEKHRTANGWELEWKYQNLVSGFDIALKMPQKLQPGPLAGRISFFAPVSLFFFFFLIFILSTLRGIDLHPMNYFFLACAFFSFHLLMAYLVDHVSIHVAFAAASVVSIALVVSYLRLVVTPRFAMVDAGLAQLIYLVLFSYAFFFEGFTGLTVTIGAIVTLFVVMQMTGRIRWDDKGARRDVPPPPPPPLWQSVAPAP